MRVFVLEAITAGLMEGSAVAGGLAAEGRLMLRALVSDLAAIHGVRPVVARDAAFELGPLAAELHDIEPRRSMAEWRRIAGMCDAVWPVAPEFDHVLERVTAMALEEGRICLNSGLDAVRIASSKLATVRHLEARGIPCVPTVSAGAAPPPSGHGWVAKPDDGAGCGSTCLLPDRPALEAWRRVKPAGDFVLQPFVPGPALSLSLLAQDGVAWLLSCNRQDVAVERGMFRYRGGIVGGAEPRRVQLEPLAARVAAALPGLWGHVGIDLIDGPQGPLLLEVNPRLTTSYVGLGRSIGLNPAALVLDLMDRRLTGCIRPLTPRPVAVAWHAPRESVSP